MTGQEALAALIADPKKFLKKHRLRVTALFTTSQQEVVWLYNDGQNFGGHDSFSIASDNPGTGHPTPVDVLGVRVYSFSDVNPTALPAATLPAAGAGPGLMATVMLTGCAVVTQDRRSGSGPFVAHIQPDAGQSGEQLEDALQGAHFAGSTHSTKVYGRRDYPHPQRATAIALREGTTWNLFTQAFGDHQIDEVKKFTLS
jgi:hypothetical protein